MQAVDRRYAITLAVTAAAILLIGSWLRPDEQLVEPIQGPSQADVSRLTLLSQRRSLDNITEYFGGVAAGVEAGVVSLRLLDRSGLVWEPGLVVTTRLEPRFPAATTLTTPAGDIGVVTTVGGPHLPLAGVQTPETAGLAPPARRRPVSLEAGEWTLLLWRRGDTLVRAPATYLGTTRERCGDAIVDEVATSVALTDGMAGGGLFDLEGNLLAAVLSCGNRLAAVTADRVDTLLRQGRTIQGRILHRYGLRLEEMTAEEQAHFGSTPGLIVREVWSGYLAEAAGLTPGDRLFAINAELVAMLDQLEPFTEPAGIIAFDLAIRRGEEIIRTTLPADPATIEGTISGEATAGMIWEPPPLSGHRIDDVVANSVAERAGLRPGDRLLRIDGHAPADLEEVRATLSPERLVPAFVELQRHGRRWGVLLR